MARTTESIVTHYTTAFGMHANCKAAKRLMPVAPKDGDLWMASFDDVAFLAVYRAGKWYVPLEWVTVHKPQEDAT